MSIDTVAFSVVIPLYNKGPHIERAIRSVLEQDYPAAEIIVVDDSSTDGGADIVRRFGQVTLLSRSEPGPGGYAARNFGIEASSSEWIAFLDADDRWRPDHLATLASAILANRAKIGCAFTLAVLTDGAGAERPRRSSKALGTGIRRVDFKHFLAAWVETGSCPIWTGAVAIRRSDLIAAGMFPAGKARRGGDKDLWLRVMARTTAVFVPKVTAEFHQDTVNRVTKSLDHTVQPIICRTIRSLLPRVTREERRLLRRLNNKEVVFYTRYAAGSGAPFNRDAVRTLHGPAFASLAALLSYAVAGRFVRLVRPRRAEAPDRPAAAAARPVPVEAFGAVAATERH